MRSNMIRLIELSQCNFNRCCECFNLSSINFYELGSQRKFCFPCGIRLEKNKRATIKKLNYSDSKRKLIESPLFQSKMQGTVKLKSPNFHHLGGSTNLVTISNSDGEHYRLPKADRILLQYLNSQRMLRNPNYIIITAKKMGQSIEWVQSRLNCLRDHNFDIPDHKARRINFINYLKLNMHLINNNDGIGREKYIRRMMKETFSTRNEIIFALAEIERITGKTTYINKPLCHLVKEALMQHKNKPLSAKDVFNIMNEERHVNSIRSALHRLADKKEIVRISGHKQGVVLFLMEE